MSTHLVRNLFDQYSQPENRVTHALAQVLARNQRLIRDFVRFAAGVYPPKGFLALSCQAFPGEQQQPISEEEAERRGVPDLWISSEPDGWALVCECKVTATPTQDQLQRHVGTARRLGFKAAHLLVITADELRPGAVPHRINGVPVSWINWAQLFALFGKHAQEDHLVAEFLNYVRVVEVQLMAKGYDGPPLTKFTGIPFGPDHPYTGPEATVLLRALMAEFRRKLTTSSVQVEPSIRRPAIALRAWDVIGFGFADRNSPFNHYPHLTVGIDDREAWLALTLPNQDVSGGWRRLRRAGKEQLKDALEEVARRLRPIRRHVTRDIWEPRVYLHLFQRHFHAQRYGTMDGEIKFDLDVLFEDRRESRGRAKVIPAWLDAIHMVLAQTARANFELMLRAEYPLIDGSVTRRADFAGSLVQVAEAFQPFLALLAGVRSPRRLVRRRRSRLACRA